jgi:hypothetical protein
MGLPIMVQLTESERNKLHPGDGLVPLHNQSVVFAHSVPLEILIFPPVSLHPTEELCSASYDFFFELINNDL